MYSAYFIKAGYDFACRHMTSLGDVRNPLTEVDLQVFFDFGEI